MYATKKINARNLKTLRMLMDFNQQDVAKRMGICLSAYQSKENGHIEFKASELNKLAKIFDVPMESFFMSEAEVINWKGAVSDEKTEQISQ